MLKIYFLITLTVLLAAGTLAQEPMTAHPDSKVMVFQKSSEAMQAETGPVLMLQEGGGGGDAVYLREMIFSGDAVKGAPYSATAITESTQVLSDGNRIVHKSSAFVARDGQGRTRRDENFGEVGGLSVHSGKISFISDPSTNTDYVLNPDEQVARVVKRESFQREEPQAGEIRKKIRTEAMKRVSTENPGEFKHESLGTQVIEGVTCEGTRETKIIPAGAIGNERPLEITSESWISKDLHVLVLRKRNDPRMGETAYRLTNIKLGEPDAALFEVPSGYKTTTITEPRNSRE